MLVIVNGTIPSLVIAFVNSVFQALVAFGINISTGQNVAITTVINTALALGIALYHLMQAEKQLKAIAMPGTTTVTTVPTVTTTTVAQENAKEPEPAAVS